MAELAWASPPDCLTEAAMGNPPWFLINILDQVDSSEPIDADGGERWIALGGRDLEKPLKDERVKLVSASYLVGLAEAEPRMTLPTRQELPPEAFVHLSDLKSAGSATIKSEWCGLDEEWLRIIVVSWPWLSPEHPDPHGENLRLIALALQAFMRDCSENGRPTTYGVLLDYTSLPQGVRTAREEKIFESALPTLGLFFSHRNTIVLKVTSFPEDYPESYNLPETAHRSGYAARGWCHLESALSRLVKSANKNLDLAKLPNSQSLWNIMEKSRPEPTPPLHPEDFRKELAKKTFGNRSASLETVATLYAQEFQRHVGQAKMLDYSGLGWDDSDAHVLLSAVEGNKALTSLNLERNKLGEQGAGWLAMTLQRAKCPLVELSLGGNAILVDGARLLSDALVRNDALRTLDLQNNRLGEGGAMAVATALESSSFKLTTLNLSLNALRAEGGKVIGKALAVNRSLTSLDLSENMLGSGATALGEALRQNSTLTSLNLQRNGVDPVGARALAVALHSNRTLHALKLQDNFVGAEGVDAFREMLLTNRTLSYLNLQNNYSTPESEQELREAVAGKEVEIHTGTPA